MLMNMSKVSVFSNNLSALEIFNLAFASEITEARPVSTDTVLCRRNPRHAYRTYLRARKITQQEEHDLAQWFDHQPAVKPSAALKLWLTGPAGRSWYNRCSLRADYYFEYDAVSTATAFNLCFNNLLGKTLELRRLE